MNHKQAAEFALESLKKAGAEKAQVIARSAEKDELNVEIGELSLFRTVINPGLSLKAIRGGRMGKSQLNRLDKDSIARAVEEVMGLLEASSPDPAYDIGPKVSGSFENGAEEPDPEAMHARLGEMLAGAREEVPTVIMEGAHLDFSRTDTTLLNSNGAELHSRQGGYGFTAMFTAKSNGKASSFNYTYGSLAALDRPLLKTFGLEELLRQSAEQTETRSVPEKFMGDLVVTPHCLADILGALLSQLGDQSLIAGSSLFKDRLGERISSPLLTVSSEPAYSDFATREFFDGEGFLSEGMPILSEGVLKSFLLSQYGANKTGKPKARSSGSQLVVSGGKESFESLIAGTKRGVLLCRFSGGRPDESGDFSGVAKNSYYIEDGKIRFPVSETMVSGNLAELFRNILGVSSERINFGSALYPWMRMDGVTVSGK
jgi:PmbA protein